MSHAGGWLDIQTMKRSYQQPDPVTTLRAIENAPDAAKPASNGQDMGKPGATSA